MDCPPPGHLITELQIGCLIDLLSGHLYEDGVTALGSTIAPECLVQCNCATPEFIGTVLNSSVGAMVGGPSSAIVL